MPKGSPSKQTIASKKYQDKVGLIAKSYKLKRDTVEKFGRACEAAGISQSAKITQLMEDFIRQQGIEEE